MMKKNMSTLIFLSCIIALCGYANEPLAPTGSSKKNPDTLSQKPTKPPFSFDTKKQKEEKKVIETQKKSTASPIKQEKSFSKSKALSDDVICPSLKGLILVNQKSKSAFSSDKSFEELVVVGLDVPGGAYDLNSYLKSKYFGKPLTQKKLHQLKQDIQRYWRKHNLPLTIVHLPSQSLRDGIIRMEILESTLNEVHVTNNDWFADSIFTDAILLQPGELIDEGMLVRNIHFLNRNTFRHVDAIYTPGKKTDTTDIELYVQDRLPFRLYSGLENTGTHVSDRYRWFLGTNWGNALWLDQVLSYQFTAAFDIDKFQAHSLQWQIPLFHKHILSFYGGYSYSNTDLSVTRSSDSPAHGNTIQVSTRYTIPLIPSNYLCHEIYVGFDFKRTDTNIDFVSIDPKFSQYVNIGQFCTGYGLTYDISLYKTSFDLGLFVQPGGWLPDQENRRYNALRTLARNFYFYLKTSWTNILTLPYGFAMHLNFKTQLSTANLLPSEQFGIGGYNTVRGYDERELNGDNAFLTNFEFRLPSFKIFNPPKKYKIYEGMQFLGFFDYGVVGSHRHIDGERPSRYLIGMGPGVRYVLDPYLTIRLDIGFKLHDNPGFTSHNPMYHFMTTFAF